MTNTAAATFRGITDEVTTCGCCYRRLKRTVLLDFDGEVVHYGTTCAARALGMTSAAVTNAAQAAQSAAEAAEAVRAERRTVYAAAAAALEARDFFAAELVRARDTFNRAPHAMGLRAFCAHVAETGEIPA